MLAPEVVLRDDSASVLAATTRRVKGAPALVGEIRGAASVADTFSGHAQAAQLALIEGVVGAVWAPGGKPRTVVGFTITAGKIVAIDLRSDPQQVRRLDVIILDNGRRQWTSESYAPALGKIARLESTRWGTVHVDCHARSVTVRPPLGLGAIRRDTLCARATESMMDRPRLGFRLRV